MAKTHLQVTGVVVGVALAAYVLYDLALGLSRGGAVHWLPLAEGALIAVAVLAVWIVATTRQVAALGLGVAVVIVLGAAAGIEPALKFAQEPMGGAAVFALLARLALPAGSVATDHHRAPAAR
jgi:hypothetical protein